MKLLLKIITKKSNRYSKCIEQFSYLFYPSAGISPGMLISGYRRGEGPLLRTNAIDSPALDGQEDETAQQGIGHEKGAYPEVYDKSLQEWMLAGFVRHTAEAQTSHLARRVRLRTFRCWSFQGRSVAVIRWLKALVSSVMSNVVLLHPLFCPIYRITESYRRQFRVYRRICRCTHTFATHLFLIMMELKAEDERLISFQW